MLTEEIKKRLIGIWDNYVASNRIVLDTKRKVYDDIDSSRVKAIENIKQIILGFQKNELNIYEFKSSLDSFNKRNNLWGFTATKGQMFFNQLVKVNESNIPSLTNLIKELISEPKSLNDALVKIEKLENYTMEFYSRSTDKRKSPNPGSSGYFLSYFWQVHDYLKWPILYTSLQSSFNEIGIWVLCTTQKDSYSQFFVLNEEVKSILSNHTGETITNWDAEHAFWNFKGNPHKANPKKKEQIEVENSNLNALIAPEQPGPMKASFDLNEYLIPRVSKLIDVGMQNEMSASAKGCQYEKLVCEIFKLIDFEVQELGQGTGRNPDAILKFREENTAFIVDAKAYTNGYKMGLDDRAIKEYINHYCPKLVKDGFKKIGFIIVSNSFTSTFDSFINEITWNTEIKRFILLESEALLYLLAFKTRDKLSLNIIIEKLVGLGNLITPNEIIQEFDDV